MKVMIQAAAKRIIMNSVHICSSRENICFVFHGENHANKVELLKRFFETERYIDVVAPENEKMVSWKWNLIDLFKRINRYVVLVTKEALMSDGFLFQLQWLNSSPEHIISIFPILLDDCAIPQEISHYQVCKDTNENDFSQETKEQLLTWYDSNSLEEYTKEQVIVNDKLKPLSLEKRLVSLRKKNDAPISQEFMSKIEQWERNGSLPIFALRGKAGTGKTLFATNLFIER